MRAGRGRRRIERDFVGTSISTAMNAIALEDPTKRFGPRWYGVTHARVCRIGELD